MSNINVVRKNLGPVTAYKYAVQQGYTGTEQEFAVLMASYATVAQEAEAAKDDAVDAKTAAEVAQQAAEAAAESLEVDDTLSVEDMAADAKATGDKIGELKSAIDNIVDADTYFVDVDFGTSNIVKYISPTTNAWTENGIVTCGIYPIPENTVSLDITANDTLSCSVAFLIDNTTVIGETPSYVSGTNRIVVSSGTSETLNVPDGANYLYVIKRNSSRVSTIPAVCRFNVFSVPALSQRVDIIEDRFISETSVNLFDKADAVYGYYINPATGNAVSQADHFYCFFEIDSPGTYRFYGDYTLFGSTSVKSIPVFDSERQYKTYITGSHFGEETAGNWYGIQFSITAAHITSGYKFFALSQRIDNMERFMLVKGIGYPSEYVPYFAPRIVLDDVYVEPGHALGTVVNRLYEKIGLFFGDSICNGSSAKDKKNGWAGRIGTANSMNWWNYGVNGGTITQVSGHHFIGGDIETALTNYPDADFLILEGGTNDADTLHEEGLGTFSTSDFSGNYDTATFSGAFETLIYKAITYFPHAHIGYIVAQKMGTGSMATRRKTFFDRAVDICAKWGIPVLNMWENTRLNPVINVQWDSSKTVQENIDAGSLYTDGQHLTPSGYELITPIIESWMKTI